MGQEWQGKGRGRRSSRELQERARELRREETPAEQLLWRELRGRRLGYRFRRQHPVGRFIADFCCIERRVIVELDGGIHTAQVEYDTARSDALAALGYNVLRFSNAQVLYERQQVLTRIKQTCELD